MYTYINKELKTSPLVSRLSSHHDYNFHPSINLAFGNADSVSVDCLSYLVELFHYLHSHTC